MGRQKGRRASSPRCCLDNKRVQRLVATTGSPRAAHFSSSRSFDFLRQQGSVGLRLARQTRVAHFGESDILAGQEWRELVEKFAPGFVKSILPVNQLPQMSKAVGLGSWAAVGGVFAFFLV